MSASKSLLALFAVVGFAAAGAVTAATPDSNAKGEAALQKILAGRVAGKPADCVLLSELRSSQIVDGTAIVYQGNRGTLWVNRPAGASFLRQDPILVSHPHGSQLCRMDIVDLVGRGTRMPLGSVSMGAFVPYTKAPASP